MSVNYNPTYFQFIPVVMSAWRKFGFDPVLTLVTNKKESEWAWMKDYAEIRPFKIRTDIDEGVWTKVARFYSYFDEGTKQCISDIDLIPLKKEYYDKLFTYPDDKLVVSDNPYIHPSLRGKPPSEIPEYLQFAGCYLVATGALWKEIMNPDNLDDEGMFNSYKGVWRFEPTEDITKPYDKFSEDTLMARLVYNWTPDKTKIKFLNRGFCPIGNPFALNRIDRGKWTFIQENLDRGEYIDSHCLRPIEGNISRIAPLIESIGLPVSLLELGVQKYKESL